MKHIDLTLPTPQENLAFDEALLNMCESGYNQEILRFWESPEYFVVLGYAGRIAAEVNLQYCKQNNVPVVRRYSGGGSVLQGPGCVNFTLILNIEHNAQLDSITQTNLYVLSRHKDVLTSLTGSPVEIRGFSDLAIDVLKFSGNAQRRRQHCILFHGTFLVDLDIARVQSVLTMPGKQPSYRRNRTHTAFLTNVHVPRRELKEALRSVWDAADELREFPLEETQRLAKTRYSSDEWTLRL